MSTIICTAWCFFTLLQTKTCNSWFHASQLLNVSDVNTYTADFSYDVDTVSAVESRAKAYQTLPFRIFLHHAHRGEPGNEASCKLYITRNQLSWGRCTCMVARRGFRCLMGVYSILVPQASTPSFCHLQYCKSWVWRPGNKAMYTLRH